MAADTPDDAPGDITRGTETAAKPVQATGAGRNEDSLEFARAQSFADPAHKGQDDASQGGLRTQETASEEGARRSEEE